MDNTELNEILASAGLDPMDFTPAEPEGERRQDEPEYPFRITTDLNAIREALDRPNTTYVAIEQAVDNDESQAMVPPEEQENIAEESHETDEALEDDIVRRVDQLLAETEGRETEEEPPIPEGVTRIVENSPRDDYDRHLGEDSPVTPPLSVVVEHVEESRAEQPRGEPYDSTGMIVPNSPTLLLDDSTSRFSGAEWYDSIRKSVVIVAGIGGIGSNAVFQIARMTPAGMFLYDDDIVEASNMSGQLFSRDDVGKTKVTAMVQMIKKYTNMTNAFGIDRKFQETDEASDIMICGFDNMSARKLFFAKWRDHLRGKTPDERRKCLYIDGRLSIDTLQVFAIAGDDDYSMERYDRDYLFSDGEADETVCSLKQTTYLACMIGSVITNLFTNFIANQLAPAIPYDFPFFTEYDAHNMIFKTTA